VAELVFFLGRFHVLALHLPIGIILAAVVAQWWARTPRHAALARALPFLWAAAAVSAIVTVVLGFMHFAEGGFSGPSASAHRLYGTSVAVVATALALASARRPALYDRLGRAGGLLLVVLVTLTGHYGGNLTHGSTYLVAYAPGPLRTLLGAQAARPRVTSVAAADPYHDVVRPILEERCGTCHNDQKRNGGFSVVDYHSTLVGGDTGRAIVPGNLAASELHYRVTLPPDDEAFMPAEGKTPLTARQVEIVRWWIEAGAPVDTSLGAVGVPAAVEPLIAAELGLAGAAATGGAAGPIVTADAGVVAALDAAGFLVRQVSQQDASLVVSVSSPGSAVGPQQLATLLTAADRIVELNLPSASLGDDGLAGFERLTALTRLRLSDNEITDAGLATLAKLPQLARLNLYGNAGVTDAGLAALADVATLEAVYLWGTRVSAEGAARLRERRPALAVQLGAAD
jgi:uncharacterized membrane protein